MKTLRITIMAILVLGITGHSGTKVWLDFDRTISFVDLRTYAWAEHYVDETANQSTDRALSDRLVLDRLRNEVDDELADMGYQMVSPSEADFLIDYQLDSQERQVTTYHTVCNHSAYGYGGYGHYGGYGYRGSYGHHSGYGNHSYYGGHRYHRSYYGQGYGSSSFECHSEPEVKDLLDVSLTLDIMEPGSGDVIWRSQAIKALKQHPDPKKVRKFIKKSVHKTLKEFPPEDSNA